MVQVKDLTELTLADLWQEVKEEEAWWQGIAPHTLRLVKTLLENVLEAELLEWLWAGRYKRTEVRRGYRNGSYTRSFTTPGLIPALRVPRARDPAFQPQVLARYQRRTQEVDTRMRELFLAGVSTRRVGEVLEPLLGERPSATTVSRVLTSLDGEVARFQRRPLADGYQYLLLDGITLKVRSGIGAKKRLVLCAYGVTPGGTRELLSFRQATAESEAQWEAFLRDLYQRGSEGHPLQLVVIDGCPGLHRALDTGYPYVPRQRCWAHKLRNVAAKLPRTYQQACRQADLPGQDQARSRSLLPDVGGALARGGPQSGGVPGGGPRGTPGLPGLPPGPLAPQGGAPPMLSSEPSGRCGAGPGL